MFRKKVGQYIVIVSFIVVIVIGGLIIYKNAVKTNEDNPLPEEYQINHAPVESNAKEQIEAVSNLSFELLAGYRYEEENREENAVDELYIEKDGYFHGYFMKKDLDCEGDIYGHCSGYFEVSERIDDFTYSLEIRDIKREYEEEYLFNQQDEILVFLPGKQVADISEPLREKLKAQGGTLESVVIANLSKNSYFSSGFRLDPLQEAQGYFDDAILLDEKYGEIGLSGVTSDLVISTKKCYYVADECLNDIWTLLKNNVSDDKYSSILEEQRKWNQTKEDDANEMAEEYGTGSFATVAYLDSLRMSTIKRCEELLEYLK